VLSLLAPAFRIGFQNLWRRFRRAGNAARHVNRRRFRPEIEWLERRDLLTAAMAEYAIPTANSGAIDIARGPDGNLWFAEESGHQVARITPSGSITQYTVSGDPVDIYAGQGNLVWFAEFYANLVGSINTSTGQVTEYAVPTANAGPDGITLGADGNVWFDEYFAGKVGRITPSGQITEFSVGGNPTDLVLGSDGNVWFTSYNTDQVGKVSTTGVATLYAMPSGSGPAGLAAGPDGNLWVTEYNTGKIARVTTSGSVSEYSIPTANSQPWAIDPSPDGPLWFAESGSNKIGEVTTSGQFTEYAVPTANADPRGITVAADGSVWWTEYRGNQIGAAFVEAAPTISLSVTYLTGRMVTLSGQVTADAPGGLTVNFTGKVVGSVVTNADGTFSGTFQATALGLDAATTTDAHGLVSNTATVVLASNPPTITNFTGMANLSNIWVFSGTVNAPSPAGLVITFGGLPSLAGKTAVVQADGTFQLTVQLQPGESGTATAQTTDWWGQNSDVVGWLVAP